MTVPYTCIRCDYKSKDKRNMRRHLYDRKIVCPGCKNNIELTEEIKDCILLNRIYHIPVHDKRSLTSLNQSVIINEGDIYLYYPRVCKNGDEYVYKIGKSFNYLMRKNNYMKGGDMLFVLKVDNRHLCENIIKDTFKKDFKQRKDYGFEYFEGDVFEMVISIETALTDNIISVVLPFTG